MSFDGIKKNPYNPKQQLAVLKRQVIDVRVVKRAKKVFVRVESIDIREVLAAPATAAERVKRTVAGNFFFRHAGVFISVGCMLVAFVAGMWVSLNTEKSVAENTPPQIQTVSVPDGLAVVASFGTVPTGTDVSTLTNNVLFNTPIEDLQSYFNPPPPQPNVLALRETQLAQFLTQYHSPLAVAASTIAQQPHWKLILAIAFAESSLGKNCIDYNCSNIGSKPSSPIWHQYNSYADWVVDFNSLLERKYNDETLKQMCGVYVQPCNPNWLLATQQILDALNKQGIE